MAESSSSYPIQSFVPSPANELASEHETVSRFVSEAAKSVSECNWYQDIDLKKFDAGSAILKAKPEEARRLTLAALQQVMYWDCELKRISSRAENELDRMNAHLLPGWVHVSINRRLPVAVIFALMRRTLPFTEDDLRQLIAWCVEAHPFSSYHLPLNNLVRAVQQYSSENSVFEPLRDALRQFAQRLRDSHEKDVKKLGTTIEQLLSKGHAEPPTLENADLGPVQRESFGHHAVLTNLKLHFNIPLEAPDVAISEEGPDHFALREDSPLKKEHAQLSALFSSVIGTRQYHSVELGKHAAGAAILNLNAVDTGRVFLAGAERCIAGLLASTDLNDHGSWQSRYAAFSTINTLATLPFEVDRASAFDLLFFISTRPSQHFPSRRIAQQRLLDSIEKSVPSEELTQGERYVLALLRNSVIVGPSLGANNEEVVRLNKLICDGSQFYLVPGEGWSDAVNEDLRAAPPEAKKHWIELFGLALKATGSRPAAKWLSSAQICIKALGEEALTNALRRWLPLVSKGRSIPSMKIYPGDTRSAANTIIEENAVCLRGILWVIPQLKMPAAEMARLIAAVGVSAYKKVPGVGPRCVKVGNAAVYALSELNAPEAVGQLAMLKVRVKFGTAQKEIEKAFNAAAEALNIPRDQIEEMGVPTYGLEEVGLRREDFGDDFRAELRVHGRDVTLSWSKADGTALKSVPAKVKSDFAEDLKELQTAAKDIAGMLPAQTERLDNLFLSQTRWPYALWKERYLDHPLIGTIARRLIWVFAIGKKAQSGIWLNDRIVDVDNQALKLTEETLVELWHPIARPLDDILAWRAWMDRHEIQQPFKQAHREIYVLTDAERRTGSYSNRFAAHILRQHQFNALCAARGWKNKLRLMVDDTYPPASRDMPRWGLRAEYWIEGAGDQYGVDTNDSGTYLRVATDQVRFYRTEAAHNLAQVGTGSYMSAARNAGEQNVNEPLALDQIDPLVFSEILRDVDLFVGVASVANDPTWQDGGPGGRYRTYWQGYSFGELTETAQTRRSVLQNLLPRLSKLKNRWSLQERFLVIRGELRTYKIHLGSGNILMEPDDQYLCIVADRSSKSTENVFLPFDGDGTLSIILSKAFLLAEDKKIKDPTITRQINRE